MISNHYQVDKAKLDFLVHQLNCPNKQLLGEGKVQQFDGP